MQTKGAVSVREMRRRGVIRALAVITLLGVTSGSVGVVHAQSVDKYPSRPITLIVPFSSGGQYDTVARMLAKPLGEKLGQPVIIDNVGGAGGTVGGAKAANAKPDGYTLLAYGGNFSI